MKKTILIILLVLPLALSYSQDQDFDKDIMIGVYANGGINKPVRLTTKYITEETSPWHGYESWSAGVRFSGMLSTHYRIEIAACYSGHKVGFELSPPIYTEKKIYTETFETVSIPVTFKRYLKNNYFFSAGTIVDFALDDKPVRIDAQTGFGLTIGAGREFRTRWITLDLAPELELHSVVPFTEDNYQQRLFVAGLRIGLSFNCSPAGASQDLDIDK
jgi:hypothetical protein